MATMMAVDDEDNEVDGDGATTNHYLVSTLVKHSTNTVSYLQSNHFVFFFDFKFLFALARRFYMVCPL